MPKLTNFAMHRGGYGGGRVANDPTLLEEILQFDPSARVVREQLGGDAGGEVEMIHYDESKMPAYKGNWTTDRGAGTADADRSEMIDQSRIWNDADYGDMTTNSNFKPPTTAWWEYAAPLVISMLAPMAGAGLMAAGVGAAGGTAGVTGAAAGLGAGSIASGAAGSSGLHPIIEKALMKVPQAARSIDSGNFDSSALARQIASIGAGYAGVPSDVVSGANSAISLAQLARRRR